MSFPLKTVPTVIVMLLLLLPFYGCATCGSVKTTIANLVSTKIDHLEVSPDIEKKLPLKVAILPFDNATDKTEAFEIVRRSFYNHFASKKYQDVELYQTDNLLSAQGILEVNLFLSVPSPELGRKLDADGLVYGTITGFDRLYLGAYSQVAVELEAKLVHASTGEVLWKAKHRRAHHEGGIPLDPISAIPTVIRAALNIRDIELLRTAEDLSREMLATLPEPRIGKVMKAPGITFVSHDSLGKWKKAGDVIRVAMLGESGVIGTFDLGEVRKAIPMTEEKQGVYAGSYTVMPGDMLSRGLVVGHLRDERGNQSEWVDALNVINIDTLPPEKPAAPKGFGRDQSTFLRWTEVPDKDVLEYRIYRSQTPRDGYAQVGRTQLNDFRDQELKNDVAYYYKISALDRAGNESELSELEKLVPSKPGPTPVSENIVTDSTWHAAASPYVIKKQVEIIKGAFLTIEPGCVIRSEGPGIVVRGGLLAQGLEDDLIQWTGPANAEGPAWDGIHFDNTNDKESRIINCKIKGATTAITLTGSSPRISRNTITENGRGILVKEFSMPVISENLIVNNREEAILCERSDPEITGNSIRENTRGGILCRSAAPIIRNNNLLSNLDFDLHVEGMSENIIAALGNYWGSNDPEKIGRKIKGPVSYLTILDAPYPEGKPVELKRRKEEIADPRTVPPTGTSGKAEGSAVADLIEQAQRQSNKGNHGEAIRILSKVLTNDPRNHRAWFLLGMSHYQMGNAAEALKSMEKAVAIDGNNVGYHYNLGLAHNDTGNGAKAEEEWRKVLSLDPQNQNAKMLLEMYGTGKE
jgi:parallel beta-helix repeat protein